VASWLCTSAQAVLTEDDIIKKELAWVAKTRKAYQHGFHGLSHHSNNVDDDRTQLQRQEDRIQLRKQEEEQRMRGQQQDEKPPTVSSSISRPNLRGPSTA
jgi:hypothetical protein